MERNWFGLSQDVGGGWEPASPVRRRWVSFSMQSRTLSVGNSDWFVLAACVTFTDTQCLGGAEVNNLFTEIAQRFASQKFTSSLGYIFGSYGSSGVDRRPGGPADRTSGAETGTMEHHTTYYTTMLFQQEYQGQDLYYINYSTQRSQA